MNFEQLHSSGGFVISVAAFILSLGTLAVKFLTSSTGQVPLSPFQVALIPSIICWCICSIASYAKGELGSTLGLQATCQVNLYTILRAVLGACTLVLYYTSMEYLPLKDAVTLFFCSPAMAALMEWVIQKESLSSSVIVGGTFTILGVFFVTQPGCVHQIGGGDLGSRLGPERSRGMLLAIIAATCNAGAFVAIRMLKGAQSTLNLTWWYHLVVASATVLPVLFGYPSRPHPVSPTPHQCFLLLGVTLAQLSGQMLLNYGFKLMSATRGSAINVMQVLWSYVWEVLILKESLNLVSAVGGVCVMAGVLTVASNAPHAKTEFPEPSSSRFRSCNVKYFFLPSYDCQDKTQPCSNTHDPAEQGVPTYAAHEPTQLPVQDASTQQ